MRSIILLTIVLNCCIELHSRPLPAGQIIKYRVSSKYFTRKNETSNELYNLLTQIHFGDATQAAATTTENVKEKTTTEINSNESTEATTTIMMDVTEQQQMLDNEQNLHAVVANDEIEKLADDTKTDAPNVNLPQSTEAIGNSEQTEVTEAVYENTSTIEIDNHDDETYEAESISTNVPNEQATHEQQYQQQEEENDEDGAGNDIPESLLNAVGDLLSSVLGITIDDDTEDASTTDSKNEIGEENLHAVTTESDNSQSTASDNEQQTETMMTVVAENDKMTEVDKKIENLNVQNTFMTETVPEIITEVVKNSDDINEEVLEVADEENLTQPVSIDASVNHVMNLIKNAAQNADRQVNDVYTSLQKIGSTFGLTESNTEEINDELKTLPIDSFDPETRKNFETDINEMVNVGAHQDEQENFVPNVAKAAMFYKYQYDDDF